MKILKIIYWKKSLLLPTLSLGCVSASDRRRCPCFVVGFRLLLDCVCVDACFHGVVVLVALLCLYRQC